MLDPTQVARSGWRGVLALGGTQPRRCQASFVARDYAVVGLKTIRVRLEPQGKEFLLDGPKRVGALLEHLGIAAGTVLVIRDRELVAEDEMIRRGEEVEVRSVISGG